MLREIITVCEFFPPFFLSFPLLSTLHENKTKQNTPLTHTHTPTHTIQHVVLHSNMDWYEDETLRDILNS